MSAAAVQVQSLNEPCPGRGRVRSGMAAVATTAACAGQTSFASCYMELCRQQGLRPLPVIGLTLPHNLDFATDRVKMDDWGPILNSLSLDHTLRSIAVRSKYYRNLPCRRGGNGGRPLREESLLKSGKRAPVVLTRFLLEWLSHSVAQCVRNSQALTHLELEGIPLSPDCLAVLCVGLSSTKSLKHFSLQRCRIGDAGCELICRTVADVQSVRSLNLSQCELTSGSGPNLASALSRQKLALYHDTWKESLRYREPNLEAMPGLRRLSLNGNHRLGDPAARQIIEAVRDSLWLKALDLRNCGITDEAAREFLDLVNENPNLSVVDLRLNAISEELLRQITEGLQRTSGNEDTPAPAPEYRWTRLPEKGKPSSVANEANRVPRNRRRGSTSPAIVGRKRPSTKSGQTAPVAPPIPAITVEDDPHPRTKLHLDLRACANGEPRRSLDNSARCNAAAKTPRLLAEEKLKREAAEAKLRAVNENLADLEAALRTKEAETRGYLLVSQRSLDEICAIFDRLLEMLDDANKNPRTPRNNAADSIVRETIKRHLAHLVRKTKSESLSRASRIPGSPSADDQSLTQTRKSTRSESDVRISLPPPPVTTPVIHLEKNIGDSPDVAQHSPCTRDQATVKRYDLYSPEQRARAIFAEIVSDESLPPIVGSPQQP